LGRDAPARTSRRGRLRSHPQHRQPARCVVTTNARFVAFLGTFNRPAEQVAAGRRPPGSRHLGCPPSVTLKRLHENFLQNCDCSDQPAAVQPPQPSAQAAALLQMRAKTRSLSTQAPRTTAPADWFFRSSTPSTRHSSGVRITPRRLPALRTRSPIGPPPFRRSAVSLSN